MCVSVDERLEYEHALTPFSHLMLTKTAKNNSRNQKEKENSYAD